MKPHSLLLGAFMVGGVSPTWAQPNTVQGQSAVHDHNQRSPDASQARRFELGLGMSFAPTLLTELYLTMLDGGLISQGGRTWLRAGFAPLAGWDNTQLTMERWETMWHTKQQRLELLAGGQWSHGTDWAAQYDVLSTLFGVRYGYRWGNSTLGGHVSYTLGLSSWLHFTDAYRDAYGGRYPDDRDDMGPERATVFFGSHRIEGAINYAYQSARWSIWSVLGIQASPTAGSLWNSLEAGQLPLLLSCAGGYRF